jgi:hypothetical protein
MMPGSRRTVHSPGSFGDKYDENFNDHVGWLRTLTPVRHAGRKTEAGLPYFTHHGFQMEIGCLEVFVDEMLLGRRMR